METIYIQEEKDFGNERLISALVGKFFFRV